jgi:hypothetical protein
MIWALIATAWADPSYTPSPSAPPAGSVDLSEMADLATDKVICRLTASTGVPEACPYTDPIQAIADDASLAAVATTLGLGTGNSPQFTGIELGHATDTTFARGAAGWATVEGKRLWRDGETVAIDDSGGSIAWDASLGRWFTVTLDGSHAYSNPTNLVTGGIYGGVITQDGTGQRVPTWGATFDPPEIRLAAASVTAVSWFYDGTKLRVLAHAPSRTVVLIGDTATVTNVAAATTEFNGGTTRRALTNWIAAQEVRFRASVATVGSAGTTMGPQYSVDGGSTWLAMDGTAAGDLGAIQPQVAIDSLGSVASSWITLPSTARAPSVLVRVVTDGGDAAADPAFPVVHVDFR